MIGIGRVAGERDLEVCEIRCSGSHFAGPWDDSVASDGCPFKEEENSLLGEILVGSSWLWKKDEG